MREDIRGSESDPVTMVTAEEPFTHNATHQQGHVLSAHDYQKGNISHHQPQPPPILEATGAGISRTRNPR